MNEVTKIDPRDSEVVHAPTGIADPMVAMIERLVLNPQADLDKLDRMLAMKERLDAQNAKVAFAGALAAARAEIPPIMKDATVDFTGAKGRTHYKHETLAGIAKVVDPILSRFGLSYRFQTDDSQNGRVRVVCIVSHAAGHSEDTSLSGAPDGSGSKNSFQALGSAVTYLQRYTLKAALGLSAEVDDDGQAAAPRDSIRRNDTGSREPATKDQSSSPRDPEDIKAHLIATIQKASHADQLRALNAEGTRFAAAWQWLEDEHRPLASLVKTAFDARMITLDAHADQSGDHIPY